MTATTSAHAVRESVARYVVTAHPINPATLLDATFPDDDVPTPLGWIDVIRRGLPARSMDALTTHLQVSQADFAAAIGIAERTLVRRKKEGTLTPEESAKLVRVARVCEAAETVFEDRRAALDWLKSANPVFAGATPLSMLDTEIGAESVHETLGRIAHGVFA